MKQNIVNLLSKHIKLRKEEILSLIETPPAEEFGDYSFPCFVLAKIMKKNPVDIATELANKIKKTKSVSAVEAKGPYLNFFIDKKELAKLALKTIKKTKKKNKKILIEHTSINPNASPHVGRIRNSLIGDSIKKILEYKGYKTETHFYVNDISKQIALLTLSSKIKKFENLLTEYIRLSKQLTSLEPKVFQILNKFEAGDKKTKTKFKKIVDIAIKGQKKILEQINIKFDYFDYESSFLKDSKKVLAELKKTGKLFKDKENRLVLDEQGQGIDEKMKAPYLVLTRNDGTGLYPLRDIAYTLYKLKKGENIIILGEDQKLYFQQIKIALKFLKKPAPKPIHYSFVLIQTKEGNKKMQTRAGNLVLFEDFLEEAVKKAKKEMDQRKTKGDAKTVAIAAVKYALLKNEPNRNIIFNLDESLNFTGDTGPYLLYSYARASSILRKSKSKKKLFFHTPSYHETRLIKEILTFQETVEAAYKSFNPSLIANYSFELAQIFNEFYQKERVIGSKEEAFRLALVQAFRQTLKQALSLLGIDVLERM